MKNIAIKIKESNKKYTTVVFDGNYERFVYLI
jgi:hypothetical protein